MAPAMDIDDDFVTPLPQRSLPMEIASPGRKLDNIPQSEVTWAPSQPIKLDHEAIKEKVRKRKKNKKKVMPAPAPAGTIVKGFGTPITSGGEESDVSAAPTPLLKATRTLDYPSITSSPALRPASPGTPGGISTLKARLDALVLNGEERKGNLARIMSSSSIPTQTSLSTRGSEGDKTEMDTYEISLEHDFISSDVAGSQSTVTKYAAVVDDDSPAPSPAPRKMCAHDFEPLRCLGKGAFGTVHLVKQHVTGRLYAQKQFRKASLTVHKRLVEQTRTERNILESVNRHPFVVKLFYAFQDHEKLYLILEYAQGGELFHHLSMERMFSEDVAAFYMAEMVMALEHLHQNVRVIYRDLKPENCLLDSEGHLLLTDFGLSKVALNEDERTHSVLGTIEYMAPEVIQGLAYDFTVDWWSLGAIGFDLMTGSPPFGGSNHAKIQQNIIKQKLQLPYFLGPDAKDFLTKLLRKDPAKRLGGTQAKDLKILKAHRFFRKIDWKRLESRELEPPIQPIITDPELAENFSTEFTELAMSPVNIRQSHDFQTSVDIGYAKMENDPFGGFSFVASQSLLDNDTFMLGA